MINRRRLLAGMGAAGLLTANPALARAFTGGLRASEYGLRAGAPDDQGEILQLVLERASVENRPVFLEPGLYRVSNVNLPENTHLHGVPGGTGLVFAGGDHFVYGENARIVEVSGVTFDGLLLPVKEYADGNLSLKSADRVTIRDCQFSNASGYGLYLERSAGLVSANRIHNAIGYAGMIGLASNGLTITGNTVEDCANGGIIAYRDDRAEDSTIISGNRVRRIAAIKGGTGQYGNGINSYQCDGVVVSDNHVSDCAYSTIRSNSCSNVNISDNTCIRAGETSIYSEFAFQGANISGNIVDGAAKGISIANMDYGGRLSICANNLVRNLNQEIAYEEPGKIFGTGILAEADIAITGNVVENAARFGMSLGWGPYMRNVVASSNMIRDVGAGMYVSVVEGVGSAVISGNVISDARRGAIIGHRWDEAVTGDLATSGAEDYPNLRISGNMLDS